MKKLIFLVIAGILLSFSLINISAFNAAADEPKSQQKAEAKPNPDDFLKAGKFDEAIAGYEALIAGGRVTKEIYMNLALAHLKKGDSLSSDPKSSKEQYLMAKDNYLKASDLDALDFLPLQGAAASCMKTGDEETFLNVLKKMEVLNPSPDIVYEEALTLEKLGKKPEALKRYTDLANEHPEYKTPPPDNKPIHYIIGVIYAEANDFEKAIPCFEKTLSINPQDEDAVLAIGKMYLEKKDNEKALKYMKDFLSVSKNEDLKKTVEEIVKKLEAPPPKAPASPAKKRK